MKKLILISILIFSLELRGQETQQKDYSKYNGYKTQSEVVVKDMWNQTISYNSPPTKTKRDNVLRHKARMIGSTFISLIACAIVIITFQTLDHEIR